MLKPLRILLADSQTTVHEGLRAVLALPPDFEVVGSAYDGPQAVALEAALMPDVTLLDLDLPRLDGLEATRKIVEGNQQAHIYLMVRFVDDQRVFQAISAGAMGFLLKDTPRGQLYQVIRDLAGGRYEIHPAIAFKILQLIHHPPDLRLTKIPLTFPEGETLRLVAQGLSHFEIAARLGVNLKSVANAIRAILDKLHLAERTHCSLYVEREGRPE